LPAAGDWLQESAHLEFAIPGIAAMELVIGCHNKVELKHVQAFIHRFDLLWPDTADIELAFNLLITHRLEYGVSIPDCIIAAVALRRQATLYTFNLKHYQVFPGLEAHEPYHRAGNPTN